ncbi:DoxX family protein [Nocardioides sp.]|uniref:DoxX family protein n=1 Tax=Nocardioides sp. TaxID=35761 RepID=UPI003566564B
MHLTRPDPDAVRINPWLLGIFRAGVALLWIENVQWKRPPDFGSLEKFTTFAVDYPVLAPWSWIVENLVLPNMTFFGWITILTEASLGAFLLVGLLTRFWALVGMVQTVAITLSVLNAPHEWEWSYYLMFLAHLGLLATAAGRSVGLDGLLRPVWQASSSRLAPILLRLS